MRKCSRNSTQKFLGLLAYLVSLAYYFESTWAYWLHSWPYHVASLGLSFASWLGLLGFIGVYDLLTWPCFDLILARVRN